MFADSLLETSWAERERRSWMTLTSFGLQAVIVGLLLLIPLLTTVGLPSGRALRPPISLGGSPPPLRHVERPHTTTIVRSNIADNVLMAPHSIPRTVRIMNETEPPPQVSYNTDPGVDGGTGGSKDGVWRALNDSLNRAVPTPVAPPPTTTREFRTSSILQGSLIRRVEPTYPPLARQARIQGTVVLAAVISKAGTIEDLKLLSGHPMLVSAAIDAVKQWRYRPYILNGDVIEVDTQITVNFVLGGQ
jgi:periplasmic protein TonB